MLVVHGGRDELIGMWQAEAVAAAAGQHAVEPFFREAMGHFDVEQTPRYLERLQRFLATECRSGAEGAGT